jgi:hypothetical protein
MIRDNMRCTTNHRGQHRGSHIQQAANDQQRQYHPEKYSMYPDFPPTLPDEKPRNSRSIQHATSRQYPYEYYHSHYQNMNSFDAFPSHRQSAHNSRHDVAFSSDRNAEYYSRSRKRFSSPIQISRGNRKESYDFKDETFYSTPDSGEPCHMFQTVEPHQAEDFSEARMVAKRRRQSIGFVNHAIPAQYERDQSDNTLPYNYDNRYSWDNDPLLNFPSFNAPQNTSNEDYYTYPFEASTANPIYPHPNSHIANKQSALTEVDFIDYHDDDLTMTPEPISKNSNATYTCESSTPPSTLGTKGGERTSELKLQPSEQELESLPNPRAKDALKVWYKRLGELVAFKNKYGHTNVRQKYPDNPQLGIWVNKQRCTRETLTKEKLAALEAIDFDWGTKKGDHAWDTKYRELLQYKAMNGNCKFRYFVSITIISLILSVIHNVSISS